MYSQTSVAGRGRCNFRNVREKGRLQAGSSAFVGPLSHCLASILNICDVILVRAPTSACFFFEGLLESLVYMLLGIVSSHSGSADYAAGVGYMYLRCIRWPSV